MVNDADWLLNEKQASNFLGVTEGTLAVWRCTGRYDLPFLKIGRLVRYRRDDLETWLKGRTRTNCHFK